MRRVWVSVSVAIILVCGDAARAWRPSAPDAPEFWLAPASSVRTPLAVAFDQVDAGKPALAVPALSKAATDPMLGGYALLYLSRALAAMGRATDATTAVRQLLATQPTGALGEAAYLLQADLAETSGNRAAAIQALQTAVSMSSGKPGAPEKLYLRLGRVALANSNRALAVDSFTRVYYDFPLTTEADQAAAELAKLSTTAAPFVPTVDTLPRDLSRGEAYFGAKRYADSRRAFVALRDVATADTRLHADLRIAQCDYFLKRYPAAYEELRILLAKGGSTPEAEYLALGVLRELGRDDEYQTRVRAFVDGSPAEPYAEEALNDLASYWTRRDEDARAAQVFGEMLERFPQGVRADRAAWKRGWYAYKTGQFGDAVKLFEWAADSMRRADYRGAWLYWAARGHEKLGETDAARAGFRQVIADYRNSYYGREAARRLDPSAIVGSAANVDLFHPSTIGQPPPAAPLIRALLTAGLYDEAVAELKFTQRTAGTSPLVEATIAYALNRRGDLRDGIIAMRRAYPQYLAEGGEALPSDLLAVIFPVQYWDLIRKYAQQRELDPYIVAALINQESTFEAAAHSSADAWGLMQVMPATGREYARTLRIAPFRTSRLTDPETNIRIGTAVFADYIKSFGGLAPALAAYNAGPSRAAKWTAERPGIDRDQFIDDLPYAETQGYVKRVLGTAEDYRALYSTGKVAPLVAKSRTP